MGSSVEDMRLFDGGAQYFYYTPASRNSTFFLQKAHFTWTGIIAWNILEISWSLWTFQCNARGMDAKTLFWPEQSISKLYDRVNAGCMVEINQYVLWI